MASLCYAAVRAVPTCTVVPTCTAAPTSRMVNVSSTVVHVPRLSCSSLSNRPMTLFSFTNNWEHTRNLLQPVRNESLLQTVQPTFNQSQLWTDLTKNTDWLTEASWACVVTTTQYIGSSVPSEGKVAPEWNHVWTDIKTQVGVSVMKTRRNIVNAHNK